jgi:hypothetical protein
LKVSADGYMNVEISHRESLKRGNLLRTGIVISPVLTARETAARDFVCCTEL